MYLHLTQLLCPPWTFLCLTFSLIWNLKKQNCNKICGFVNETKSVNDARSLVCCETNIVMICIFPYKIWLQIVTLSIGDLENSLFKLTVSPSWFPHEIWSYHLTHTMLCIIEKGFPWKSPNSPSGPKLLFSMILKCKLVIICNS